MQALFHCKITFSLVMDREESFLFKEGSLLFFGFGALCWWLGEHDPVDVLHWVLLRVPDAGSDRG